MIYKLRGGKLDILVYLDMDITVVVPLTEFFQLIKSTKFELAMFQDAGKGKEKLHGGAIVMKEGCQKCLNEWLEGNHD